MTPLNHCSNHEERNENVRFAVSGSCALPDHFSDPTERSVFGRPVVLSLGEEGSLDSGIAGTGGLIDALDLSVLVRGSKDS